MAKDCLLFIDANNYLDLYRVDKGQALLAPLAEWAEHIFVTEQVAGEVRRNKLTVAAGYVTQKFVPLEVTSYPVPDHLLGSDEAQSEQIRKSMGDLSKEVKRINKDIKALTTSIFEQIVRGEDKASKTLAAIFDRAVAHQPDELQRARERKDRGNPPGKRNDPIGDELTWEQLLTRFKGRRRLWIISRDSDFCTVFKGERYLNEFLHHELRKVNLDAEVFVFDSTVDGLSHFSQNSGVKVENFPSPAEVQEIKEEEKELSVLDRISQANKVREEARVIAIEKALRHRAVLDGGLLGHNAIEKAMRDLDLRDNVFEKAIRAMAAVDVGRMDFVAKAMRDLDMRDNVFEKAMRAMAAQESANQKAMRDLEQMDKVAAKTMRDLETVQRIGQIGESTPSHESPKPGGGDD